MANTAPPAPPKGPDLSAMTPLITAFVTAGAAWLLFEPKLERYRTLRNETGRLELGFLGFYVIPQFALAVAVLGTAIFLFGAALDVFQPALLPGFIPVAWVRDALQLHNIVAIAVVVGVMGVVIKWNMVPRLLLVIFRVLALLPIPGLRNCFGPDGQSIGWHQAKAVCEGPDKGAPLVVNYDALDRVAEQVLIRLSQQAGADELAPEPAGLSDAAKANLALFGCILEANANAHRWPRIPWAQFYGALADVQAKQPIFEPATLRNVGSGKVFFETLRTEFAAALTARGQTPPPQNFVEAADDIYDTWKRLNHEAKGSVLRLVPCFGSLVGGRVFWLDQNLRKYPKLNSDGMRPQLIKLMTRWGSLPVSDGVFVQPFAKRMAWLLLNEGVLRALPETKEVTFNSYGQAPIARLAMKAVLQRVAESIAKGASPEAESVANRLGTSAWRRFEAGDFILWSWSYQADKEAAAAKWADKTVWKWRFEDGHVLRQV